MIENFQFELWHLPLIFLAGLIGELYGSIVGGGSIVMQGMMLHLGFPLQNTIAVDNAAAIGTELGIIKETRKNIKQHWKLILFMFFPIFIGGIIGTYFLISLSQGFIKYSMVTAVTILLIYYAISSKNKKIDRNKYISIGKYIFLGLFLFFLGIYNNFIGIGEGTFGRIALISLFGMSFVGTMGLKTVAVLPARIYALIVTGINGFIFLPYLLTLWCATFFAGMYGVKIAKKIPEKYLKVFLVIITLCYLVYLMFYF